jgi:hypothetical protein
LRSWYQPEKALPVQPPKWLRRHESIETTERDDIELEAEELAHELWTAFEAKTSEMDNATTKQRSMGELQER